MYNELFEQISKKLKKVHKYVPNSDSENFYIMLLYLKYLCDNKKYTYEEVIKSETIEKYISEFSPLLKGIYSIYKDCEINKLLVFIQFENLKTLIYDFLNNYKNNKINILDKDKKIAYLTNTYPFCIYDTNGGALYSNYDSERINERKCELFKLLDKMLNIKNEYKKQINQNDISNNSLIYIYDDALTYRYIKNIDILNCVYKVINKFPNNEIIFETKYNKISTLKYRFYYEKLRRVIIIKDSDTVYMQYNIDLNDKVSIVMYDESKGDALNKIIENDRKQKDVLVKVSTDEIYENNGKIGFRLYQNKSDQTRNINDIVDENSRLIANLSIINDEIKEEVDKLINR